MCQLNPYSGRNDHLKRLDRDYYRGPAYVHWSVTMQDRQTGWLNPTFYREFRELLTHTTFRYALACPMYCLMPDHLHMLWMGIHERTDQINAQRYWRKQMAQPLKARDAELQHQSYDHVLKNEERREAEFAMIAEYIARNPERKGLVPTDGYQQYPYTGCLVPGYPELSPWQSDYWPRFWRVYSYLTQHGLFRPFADVP